MAAIHVKHPTETAAEATDDVAGRVSGLLADLRDRGEAGAIDLARRFDGWDGSIVVDEPVLRDARSSWRRP